MANAARSVPACVLVARIALAYGLACARVSTCLFVLSILSHKQVSLYKGIYNEPPRPPPRSPEHRVARALPSGGLL